MQDDVIKNADPYWRKLKTVSFECLQYILQMQIDFIYLTTQLNR